MSKYIDADELKTQLTEAVWLNKADLFVAYGTVALMPAADVQEVRHGRWELYDICSVCGAQAEQQTNYCPNCGAKMDEVEDAESEV